MSNRPTMTVNIVMNSPEKTVGISTRKIRLASIEKAHVYNVEMRIDELLDEIEEEQFSEMEDEE